MKPPAKFLPMGRRVKVVRIADDLPCQHVGQIGTVVGVVHPAPGSPRPQVWRYVLAEIPHLFYEDELEEAP